MSMTDDFDSRRDDAVEADGLPAEPARPVSPAFNEDALPADAGEDGGLDHAQPAEAAADQPERPQPQRYTRARRAHRSVAPIDDLANDGYDEDFTHDSDYAGKGGMLSGRSYRRARSEMTQLRRDLHYGQYLEIPKGRRDIFASRERKARTRSVIALIAVLAVLAVVVILLWQFMQTTWGATS